MSPAEEAQQEAAVFEDDDEDYSDMSDDSEDDDDDDSQAALPPPPTQPQPELASPACADLNASASSHDAAIPNPNSVHKLNDIQLDAVVDHPQNGVIPVQVLPDAAPSNASFFTPVHNPLAIATASASDERRSLDVVALDDSRRLFQRLWTDEEAIKILQGFFEFTSRRGTTFAYHQYDTSPFYEEIKKQLHFDFTKNQLIEKLRRLKKKYRNCVSRMQAGGRNFAFRSAHERAIYDIARKIWSASTKRAHESDDEDFNTTNPISNEIITIPINDGSISSERRNSRSRLRMKKRLMEEAAAAVPDATPLASSAGGVDVGNSNQSMHKPLASGIPNIIEETLKNCLSPLFKELINSAIREPFVPALGSGASPLNFLPLILGGGSLAAPEMPVNGKWRAQQILELEVYLKRLELVKDHIKSTLEELKSAEKLI
ncbi:putative transcription factor At3g04930 [Curcuma longa]|uniref:putative transcription factor At3g04930 n=1 Tax=Curcuma longa TaxID=136217 RepID=UPI003D9E44C0